MISSIINHMAVFMHILNIRTISIGTAPILMFMKVFEPRSFLYQYQFRTCLRYCLKMQESASASADSIPHSFCCSLYMSIYHIWLVWTDLTLCEGCRCQMTEDLYILFAVFINRIYSISNSMARCWVHRLFFSYTRQPRYATSQCKQYIF